MSEVTSLLEWKKAHRTEEEVPVGTTTKEPSEKEKQEYARTQLRKKKEAIERAADNKRIIQQWNLRRPRT